MTQAPLFDRPAGPTETALRESLPDSTPPLEVSLLADLARAVDYARASGQAAQLTKAVTALRSALAEQPTVIRGGDRDGVGSLPPGVGGGPIRDSA